MPTGHVPAVATPWSFPGTDLPDKLLFLAQSKGNQSSFAARLGMSWMTIVTSSWELQDQIHSTPTPNPPRMAGQGARSAPSLPASSVLRQLVI